MRRILVALLALGLVGIVGSAQTLTVLGPWASGGEMELFIPVLEAAEAELGIDIEYQTYRAEDLAPVLTAQFAAGQAPGDVIFMWPWFVADNATHALDLTALINPAQFSGGALDPVTVDGHIYGAAYTAKVKPGFWYRKSFFEANNLSVPTTWEEFNQLLDDIAGIDGVVAPIAAGDGVGWPLSDLAEHILVAFGGPQLHKELTSCACISCGNWKSVFRAIIVDWFVYWIEMGYFGEPTEWTQAVQLWWDGDYPLYFMGSWITGMDPVTDKTDIGVFPIPGTQGFVQAVDYAFVPAYTEYPDEAQALIQYLATAGQEIQIAQGGHLATYSLVDTSLYPPESKAAGDILVGKVVLTDLDDGIGGDFQTTFWDQLKLLLVAPERADEVIDTIIEAYDAECGCE